MSSPSDTEGKAKCGNEGGMPPNAVPRVATPLKCPIACTAVTSTIATSGAGTRLRYRVPRISIVRARNPKPVVAGLTVDHA